MEGRARQRASERESEGEMEAEEGDEKPTTSGDGGGRAGGGEGRCVRARVIKRRKKIERPERKQEPACLPACLPAYLPETLLGEAKKKSSTPTRCCPETESEEGRKDKQSVGVEGGRGGKGFPIFKRWQWSLENRRVEGWWGEEVLGGY